MRNSPSWIVSYMAILKAGAVATLLNGWWEAHEMEHALTLTSPKLVIADAERAKRIASRCKGCDIVSLDVGVVYNGFIGDTARTVAVGGCNVQAQRLMDVCEKALYEGISQALPGETRWDNAVLMARERSVRCP